MSTAHEAPGLPEMHDEAGDSPPWLPRLGILLLLSVGVWLATTSLEPAAPAEHDADAAEDAQAEEAPAAKADEEAPKE